MKHIVAIIISLALTHFSIPVSGSFESGGNTGTIEIPAIDIVPEVVLKEVVSPETKIENKLPAKKEKPVAKFKAKKAVNIRSIENVANRNLHEQLRHESKALAAEKVHFGFDKYELKGNDDFNKILQLADKLIFDPTLKVSIAGNTDSVGSDDYNEVLSYHRAEHVQSYLLELGVSADQVTMSFNGEENPAAGNDTEEGRAQNRSVEIFLYQ